MCQPVITACLCQYVIFLIYNILQVHHTSLLVLVFDLCNLNLSYQRSLILKISLGCDCKLSVVRIQTVHTYFLPPQSLVRFCWGGLFFYTCSNQWTDWLQGNNLKVLLLIIVMCYFSHIFINIISGGDSKCFQTSC